MRNFAVFGLLEKGEKGLGPGGGRGGARAVFFGVPIQNPPQCSLLGGVCSFQGGGGGRFFFWGGKKKGGGSPGGGGRGRGGGKKNFQNGGARGGGGGWGLGLFPGRGGGGPKKRAGTRFRGIFFFLILVWGPPNLGGPGQPLEKKISGNFFRFWENPEGENQGL